MNVSRALGRGNHHRLPTSAVVRGLLGLTGPWGAGAQGRLSPPCRAPAPAPPGSGTARSPSGLDTACDGEEEDRDRDTSPLSSPPVALFGDTWIYCTKSLPTSPGQLWGQGLVRSACSQFPRTWTRPGPQWKLKICSINGWMDEWVDGWMSGWVRGGWMDGWRIDIG